MIRTYLPANKPRLLEIFKLNTPTNFDPLEINDFGDYLSNEADTYLVVEVDNQIVGGTGYYVKEDDRSGRITWIFFDPACSRQELGSASVEHCLEFLRRDSRVERFIVTTSQLANKNFEKFGYKTTRPKRATGEKS